MDQPRYRGVLSYCKISQDTSVYHQCSNETSTTLLVHRPKNILPQTKTSSNPPKNTTANTATTRRHLEPRTLTQHYSRPDQTSGATIPPYHEHLARRERRVAINRPTDYTLEGLLVKLFSGTVACLELVQVLVVFVVLTHHVLFFLLNRQKTNKQKTQEKQENKNKCRLYVCL